LADMDQLSEEFVAACDPEDAASYFQHCLKYEQQFKEADAEAEKSEEDLVDDDQDQEEEEVSEED
ncbi:unnamed protein product, partial [Didymodactylos carnosus]